MQYFQFSKLDNLSPKIIIQGDDKNSCVKKIQNLIKTFDDTEWKLKKVDLQGYISAVFKLKDEKNKDNEISDYKKQFSIYKVEKEIISVVDGHKRKLKLIIRYSSIEEYAKIKTAIDFSEWLDGNGKMFHPHAIIYHLNNTVHEYYIDWLLSAIVFPLKG